MDPEITRRLQAMTASFYRTHAASFDRTRQQPWNSWGRLLDHLPTADTALRVLDIGCGNGRLGAYLHEHLSPPPVYTGTDTEAHLISAAKARLPQSTFILEALDDTLARTATYDAMFLMGVMHHVVGTAQRRQVMKRLHTQVAPSGIVALSFWQPAHLNAFDTKVVTHEVSNRLEHNDYLLGWQDDTSELRYCHHFDDDEVDELLAVTELDVVVTFTGTGNDRTNRYAVLRAR